VYIYTVIATTISSSVPRDARIILLCCKSNILLYTTKCLILFLL
jgi:hypothetical protein